MFCSGQLITQNENHLTLFLQYVVISGIVPLAGLAGLQSIRRPGVMVMKCAQFDRLMHKIEFVSRKFSS